MEDLIRWNKANSIFFPTLLRASFAQIHKSAYFHGVNNWVLALNVHLVSRCKGLEWLPVWEQLQGHYPGRCYGGKWFECAVTEDFES
jgi:hypothetical protein